jgi:hypothetical protein
MSNLSLTKLEDLLSLNNFSIQAKYHIHGYLAYITSISPMGDNIIVSIPSDYKIKVREAQNSWKIRPLSIREDEDPLLAFTGAQKDSQIENTYDEIDLHIENSVGMDKSANIISTLDESYKRRISLRDLERSEVLTIKKIYRQLRRFRYCTSSLRYKLAIGYSNYIFILERDSSVEAYDIKGINNTDKNRKLFFLVDLELFFEKIESKGLNVDLRNIRDSFYKILNKTQEKHLVTLDQVVSKGNILEAKAKLINKQKNVNTDMLKKFSSFYEKTENKLNDLEKQLKELEEKKSGLSDSNLLMTKNKIQMEIKNIKDSQNEGMQNYIKIKEKNDNLFLSSDEAIFDNIILAHAIFKNLSILNTDMNK